MRKPLCSSRNVFAHRACDGTQANDFPPHAQTFFSSRGCRGRPRHRSLALPGNRYPRNPLSDRAEFEVVFAELRAILKACAPKLKVVHDTSSYYYLDTHTIGKNKKPIMFAAARIGKGYVSYYFMPVYGGAIKGMSPALKKRMQGKACFNFTKRDAELLSELSRVTRQGYDAWRKIGWVE